MRLADFIEANRETILTEWEAFAATLLPAAGVMDAAALRDHASQILEAVVLDLRSSQTSAEQLKKSHGKAFRAVHSAETAAETHAVLRATSGFTMQQLVAEYRALRASVLRLWTTAHPDRADADGDADMLRFNEAIDQAVAESVDFFTVETERWRNVFLGVLGHDLRGPLNAILLTSRLVEAMTHGSPVSAATARLIRSGERMKQLLDDLLDYSRASLDLGIPISPELSDLRVACEEEIELQRAALPKARVEFVSDGSTVGTWDASRLKQALGNLVANAAKYGDPDGLITVRLTGSDAEVQLSVENDGSIGDDSHDQLFDALHRGPAKTLHEERASLGLGLFIVRHIAHAHGGKAAVSSGQGRTVFTVTLPKVYVPQNSPLPLGR